MATAFLPEELITEVLLFLPVKSLIRLKCIRKSWNKIISDPTFIQMHLNCSARNHNLLLCSNTDFHIVPIHRLFENPQIPITLPDNPICQWTDTDCASMVGSCNGLLCFVCTPTYGKSWLCFCNPFTRTVYNNIGFFRQRDRDSYSSLRYTFGLDISTGNYKVVALRSIRDNEGKLLTRVRVFSLGDKVWRDIQNFPVVPLHFFHSKKNNNGVYLSGSLNWLTLRNCNDLYSVSKYVLSSHKKCIAIDQFVIISLDLGTETHMQFMPPSDFIEVPYVEPTICVLIDCLCFSHDLERTHFLVWQMREFGVEESWTQFLKISYHNSELMCQPMDSWLPLHLSKDGDILILANKSQQAILYKLRDNKVARHRITNEIWWYSAKDYVESMVSIC